MSIETEAKLAAFPGFEVPPLDEALTGVGVVPHPPVTMDARYFDADDLRLLRAGITLRHRSGEGPAEGTWTLKVAQGQASDGIARRSEHLVTGALDETPHELAVRVRPWLRTAPLQVVAHLCTVRQSTQLTVDDQVVGEVADDEVSVVVDDHVAVRFREVEVETDDAALRERRTSRSSSSARAW